MVFIQWKAILRHVNAYHTVSLEAVYVLAVLSSIKIVTDKRKRLYSAIRQINAESGKALRTRHEERQVTICGRKGSLEARKESGLVC